MVQLPKIWSNEEKKTYSKDPPILEVGTEEEEEEEEDEEDDGRKFKKEYFMMGGYISVDGTGLSEDVRMVLERSMDV